MDKGKNPLCGPGGILVITGQMASMEKASRRETSVTGPSSEI